MSEEFTPSWPSGLKCLTQYRRRHDMGRGGGLGVYIQEDGDVVLTVQEVRYGDYSLAACEFCTGTGGGGKSSRVRQALLNLADAIRQENEETPHLGEWS